MITTDFLKSIKNASFILVGENHGINENAIFIKSLVDAFPKGGKIDFVGFEYPIFARHEFLKAVKANDFGLIEKNEVAQMLMTDGRFSKAHFETLVHLHLKKIPFIFFDSGTGSWDDRDKAMYENIMAAKKGSGKAIIVAGNIHTSLTKLNLAGQEYKPLGAYFDKKEVFLINLEYDSGEFFNFGRKTFPKNLSKKEGFGKFKNNQVEYHIPVATPTQ